MSRLDIMLDIETLGHKTDSTIIQIAAVAFDIETGQHISEFNEIADITQNKELRVTGETIKWWLNTNTALLTELINKGCGSSEEMLDSLRHWIMNLQLQEEGEVYLWGNGILFDNKMIQHQMEAAGIEYPIFYRNDRDLRTLLDIASAKLGTTPKELAKRCDDPSLRAHDAFDDVRWQISIAVNCYNILTKEVQEEDEQSTGRESDIQSNQEG